MSENLFSWIFFLIVIVISLLIDLGAHRQHIRPKVSNALLWSAFWIGLALLFNIWIFYTRGSEDALKFLSGYLVEKALSIDNLFVFLIIFGSFQIPYHFRYKVLFWGIVGAFVMRGLFITLGVALLYTFHWIIYVFAFFIIYTGIRLIFQETIDINLEKNPIILWFKRWLPMTSSSDSGHFLTSERGCRVATPLFLALVAVIICDLIFAIDSIPAILGITTDPYLVYTSNIFAILGLRSLYFALEGMMTLFRYLHYGLAAILIFIGLKMLLSKWIFVPIGISLAFILATLSLTILISILVGPKKLS